MMTEEEKKAIEYLKNRLEILHNNTQWATENSIKVVLNLIEKQQKEIEELKQTIVKATEIIDEYADEIENDTKKLIEYQEKYLDN